VRAALAALVWAAWAFILILVIAAFAAMMFALLTAPACASVDAETITEETVEVLRAAGWYSTQTDDAERLYHPECSTPGSLQYLELGYRGADDGSVLYAPSEDYETYSYDKPVKETVVCDGNVDWIGLTTYKEAYILIEYNDCKTRAMGGTDKDLMQSRDHERAHAKGWNHGEGTPQTNAAYYVEQALGD
jgi:hypothetical protein